MFTIFVILVVSVFTLTDLIILELIQKKFEHIIIKLVLSSTNNKTDLENRLIKVVRDVMGNSCNIDFEYVDEIKSSKSGKYMYTICEL